MAFTIGAPQQVLVMPTTASLQAPDAEGASGVVTYQWYRSLVAQFTPSSLTLLTDQTETALLDTGLTANTIYYYAIVATDSVGPVTVTSAIVGICTAAKGQMSYQNPSVAQFQSFFDRDFPYGTDVNTSIRQQDILKAFMEANNQINPCLYLSQSSYSMGYLYYSAHALATNIVNSSQGVNGQYNGMQQSKSVGPISESFVFPQQILNNPYFAALAKTTYGNKYLMDLLPRLTGATGSVFGNTKA